MILISRVCPLYKRKKYYILCIKERSIFLKEENNLISLYFQEEAEKELSTVRMELAHQKQVNNQLEEVCHAISLILLIDLHRVNQ